MNCVCSKGAKLGPNCNSRYKMLLSIFFLKWTSDKKKLEEGHHAAVVCIFTSCDRAPCSPALCTNKSKHCATSGSWTLLFHTRALLRLGCIHLKSEFYLITLSHNFANCLFIGELSAKPQACWARGLYLLDIFGGPIKEEHTICKKKVT